MPKEINSNSSGTAKFINVVSQKAIIGGIPYYVNVFDTYGNLWQNSTIRGFLNGTDVCNIQTNGNPECSAQNGGNFTNMGFLQQAFDSTITLSNQENRTAFENFASHQTQEQPYQQDCEDLEQI